MISDGKYHEFECAFSTDRHYLSNPISLICGHSTCRTCLFEQIIKNNKCGICNICKRTILINESDFNECRGLQISLERNIGDLLKVIHKQGLESINQLNG